MRNFNLQRRMGDYQVTQRTSDGMFCASELLNQWNATDGNNKRLLKDFLKSQKEQEFIRTIIHRESGEATSLHGDNQQLTNEYALKVKKGHRGGKNGGHTPDEVWMHPYLFLDFAMWLNPEFKYDVLKFVYDQLIEHRNRIADNHRRWTDALQRLGAETPYDYQYPTMLLNCAVAGYHKNGLRDELDDDTITKLDGEVDFIVRCVECGMIGTLRQLHKYLYDKAAAK